MIDARLAQEWVQRWDRQQERYMADREERFTVVADVVAELTTARPQVLDLGCGPGSLSDRLGRRLPRASLLGVDNDRLLLELGRSCYPGVTFAEADMAAADWPARAGVPEQVDAAVSSTALHWMAAEDLEQLYRQLGELLRPGGVFVNADHLMSGSPVLDVLSRHVRDARATRVGVDANEDWRAWWDAILSDGRLGDLVEQRAQQPVGSGPNKLSLCDHVDLLRQAGFTEVGTVWQSGDDYVLVGIR